MNFHIPLFFSAGLIVAASAGFAQENGFSSAPEPASSTAGEASARVSQPAEPLIEYLMVDEMPVSQLTRMLTRASGRTVVASRSAGNLPCSVFFENVPLEEAIKVVCRMHGLWYRKAAGNVIEIVTADEYRDGLTLYREDNVEVIRLFYPAVTDVGETLSQLYPNRIVWIPPSEDAGDPYERMQNAMDRMDLMLDRAQFSNDGSNNSSGSYSSGGSRNSNSRRNSNSSSYSRSGNRSSGSSTRTGQQTDAQVIKSLEATEEFRKDSLGKVSAEKLSGSSEASLQELANVAGIVYVSAFLDTNTLLLRSHDRMALNEIKGIVKQLDTVAPQVLLEVRVLELSLTDDYEKSFEWDFSSGKWSGALAVDAVSMTPLNSLIKYASADFNAKIQFYAKDGRVTALATPTLLVRDNEASRIFIGQEATVLESVEVIDTTTISNGTTTGGTTISPVTSRRNLGDTLLITPKIHPDKSITLRLLHENSKAGVKERITYGGGDDEKYTFDSTPVVQSTITTTIVAQDGEPVVIGGLIREQMEDETEGVPYLRNIPLLGNLFEEQVKKRSRSELIVVVRPHIQIAPGETAAHTQQFLKERSQHPSAQGTIPEGGFTKPEEMLTPKETITKELLKTDKFGQP